MSELSVFVEQIGSICDYHRVHASGRDGIFVLHCKERGTDKKTLLVAKGSNNVESEVFSSLFATRISKHLFKDDDKILIRAPKIQTILDRQTNKNHDIHLIKQLEDALTTIAKSDPEREVDIPSIERLGTRPLIMITEFIDEGIGLRYIQPEKASTYFRTESPQDSCLRTIGRSLVIDLLINNWDRLPLTGVWDNEGNARNMLLQKKKDSKDIEILLIDQAITNITIDEKKNEYCDKISNCVEEALSNLEDTNLIPFTPIRTVIQENVFYDVETDGIRILRDGFKEAISNLFSKKNWDLIDTIIDECLEEEGKLLDAVPGDVSSSIMIIRCMMENDLAFLKDTFRTIYRTVTSYNNKQ